MKPTASSDKFSYPERSLWCYWAIFKLLKYEVLAHQVKLLFWMIRLYPPAWSEICFLVNTNWICHSLGNVHKSTYVSGLPFQVSTAHDMTLTSGPSHNQWGHYWLLYCVPCLHYSMFKPSRLTPSHLFKICVPTFYMWFFELHALKMSFKELWRRCVCCGLERMPNKKGKNKTKRMM